jgi:hypothetical protein
LVTATHTVVLRHPAAITNERPNIFTWNGPAKQDRSPDFGFPERIRLLPQDRGLSRFALPGGILLGVPGVQGIAGAFGVRHGSPAAFLLITLP